MECQETECQEAGLTPRVEDPAAGRAVDELTLPRALHLGRRHAGAAAEADVAVEPGDRQAAAAAPKLVVAGQERLADPGRGRLALTAQAGQRAGQRLALLPQRLLLGAPAGLHLAELAL